MKEFEKTQRHINNSKRKRDVQYDSPEEARYQKRMKCHQRTFKDLCHIWKSEYKVLSRSLVKPLGFNNMPLDMKIMICKLKERRPEKQKGVATACMKLCY